MPGFSVVASAAASGARYSLARRASAMPVHGNDPTISTAKNDSIPHFDLPYPGEDALQHASKAWIEHAEAKLAGLSLLGVAEGQPPDECMELEPVDIDSLFPLPDDSASAGYWRTVEMRAKMLVDNERNELKSIRLILAARTRLYYMVYSAVSGTAPMLAREIMTQCKVTVFGKATFDGPLAWRLAVHPLQNAERTQHDKEYYRVAEEPYRKNKLPAGCSPAAFTERVLAFIVHIWPNQVTQMSRQTAGEFVLELMPDGNNYLIERRRLRAALVASGRLGDVMHVHSLAREVIYDEQKNKTHPTPSFVTLRAEDCYAFDPAALAVTCGLQLSTGHWSHADQPGGAALSGGTPGSALSGTGRKWCPSCPHTRQGGAPAACFCGPDYTGPLPPNVWLDDSRRRGIIAQRKSNGLAALPEPKASTLKDFKKKRAERQAKKAAGAGAPKQEPGSDTQGGVAIDTGAAAAAASDARAFLDGVMDLGEVMCMAIDGVTLEPNIETDFDDDRVMDETGWSWYVIAGGAAPPLVQFAASAEQLDYDRDALTAVKCNDEAHARKTAAAMIALGTRDDPAAYVPPALPALQTPAAPVKQQAAAPVAAAAQPADDSTAGVRDFVAAYKPTPLVIRSSRLAAQAFGKQPPPSAPGPDGTSLQSATLVSPLGGTYTPTAVPERSISARVDPARTFATSAAASDSGTPARPGDGEPAWLEEAGAILTPLPLTPAPAPAPASVSDPAPAAVAPAEATPTAAPIVAAPAAAVAAAPVAAPAAAVATAAAPMVAPVATAPVAAPVAAPAAAPVAAPVAAAPVAALDAAPAVAPALPVTDMPAVLMAAAFSLSASERVALDSIMVGAVVALAFAMAVAASARATALIGLIAALFVHEVRLEVPRKNLEEGRK